MTIGKEKIYNARGVAVGRPLKKKRGRFVQVEERRKRGKKEQKEKSA